MIASLKGIIDNKGSNFIVVDVKVMCDKDAYVVQRQRIEQNIE